MALPERQSATFGATSSSGITHGAGASIFWIVSLAVYLLAIVYFLGRIGLGDLGREFYYQSDNLWLPVFLKNLTGPATLKVWRFPPNIYLLPEVLLFGGLELVLRNVHLSLVVFSLIQLVAYGLALFYFLKNVASSNIAYIVFLLLSLVCVRIDNSDFYYWQFFLLNSFHFGAVTCNIVSLYLVNAVIFSKDAGPAKSAYGLLLAFSTICSFSDLLYIVQFCGPMVLLLLLTAFFFPWLGRSLVTAAILTGSSVLGIVIKKLCIAYTSLATSPRFFDPQVHFAALGHILSAFTELFDNSPIVTVVSLGCFVAAVVFVCLMIRKHGKFALLYPKAFFLMFCLLSAMANVAAGVLFLSDLFRYFLPILFIYPLVFLLLLVDESAAAGSLFGKKVVLAAAVLPLVGMIWFGRGNFSGLANLSDYYPEEVACIDANAERLGLRYGLANYDQANYLNIVSKKNLLVASVYTDMRPQHHLNSLQWYSLPFDFALIDTSSPYQPDVASKTSDYREYVCGQTKLVVFDEKYRIAPFTLYELYQLKNNTYPP